MSYDLNKNDPSMSKEEVIESTTSALDTTEITAGDIGAVDTGAVEIDGDGVDDGMDI